VARTNRREASVPDLRGAKRESGTVFILRPGSDRYLSQESLPSLCRITASRSLDRVHRRDVELTVKGAGPVSLRDQELS
jgi:hypothetical protein